MPKLAQTCPNLPSAPTTTREALFWALNSPNNTKTKLFSRFPAAGFRLRPCLCLRTLVEQLQREPFGQLTHLPARPRRERRASLGSDRRNPAAWPRFLKQLGAKIPLVSLSVLDSCSKPAIAFPGVGGKIKVHPTRGIFILPPNGTCKSCYSFLVIPRKGSHTKTCVLFPGVFRYQLEFFLKSSTAWI